MFSANYFIFDAQYLQFVHDDSTNFQFVGQIIRLLCSLQNAPQLCDLFNPAIKQCNNRIASHGIFKKKFFKEEDH